MHTEARSPDTEIIRRKDTPAWLVKFLLWFCGILMGAGGMGITVVGQVHTNTIEIGHVKADQARIVEAMGKADADLRDQQKSDRESFDRRMNMVVNLLEKEIGQQTELITLIKVQQQIGKP